MTKNQMTKICVLVVARLPFRMQCVNLMYETWSLFFERDFCSSRAAPRWDRGSLLDDDGLSAPIALTRASTSAGLAREL